MEKIKIFTCEIFERELVKAIELEGFSDIETGTFPVYCMSKLFSKGSFECNPKHEPNKAAESMLLMGGLCLERDELLNFSNNEYTCLKFDQCHKLVLNEATVESYITENVFLLTPGWLRRWRKHIESWGFDRETAVSFFHESVKRLLLLDTLTDSESLGLLESFGDFVELPTGSIPVGLDLFRCRLARLVFHERFSRQKMDVSELRDTLNKRTADYEMSLDLINKLVNAETEDSAIDLIIELFAMLLAPSKLAYISIGRNMHIRTWPFDYKKELNQDYIDSLYNMEKKYEWIENKRGFRIKITHEKEVMAFLEISDIAFNEYMEKYIRMAVGISVICGLAIAHVRQKEELQSVVKTLDEFARNVAHDLRGPLGQVSSARDLIKMEIEGVCFESSTEEIIELMEILEAGIDRSLTLVDSLLELARSGEQPRDIEAVCMRGILNRVLDERKEEIEKAGIKVLINDNSESIRANPTQMYQIISNIIGNAVAYSSSAHEPEIRISFLGKDASGFHGFKICDNGPGISPEDLSHVFELFYKGSSGGSGIGLSIAAGIVKAYGGEIKAHNENGACFEFTLKDVSCDIDSAES